MPQKQFQSISINFRPGPHTRFDMMDGREYLVAPVVMLTTGVHKGSNGPVLYEEKDLAKFPETWNLKPLVVYHPMQNGQGISACSREVIETQGVGVILNTRWDGKVGKLRAEAWFDLEKVRKVDERILEALESGTMMEVSTGLFTDNELSDGTFEQTGEDYTMIARNYRPDHLAILPDKIGACSIEDGAGLLQTNALSHADVSNQLARIVRERFMEEAWLVDVYDGWFVFHNNGKLWRLSYTMDNDVVKVEDGMVAESVIPQTVYRTVDGELVGNSTAEFQLLRPKEDNMPKKDEQQIRTLTDSLIANEGSPWSEDQRGFLESQSVEFLTTLSADPEPKDPKEATEDDQPKDPAKAETPPAAPAANPEQNQAAQQPQTLEQLLANADPSLQGMIRQGVATYQAQRQETINKILQSPGCTFNQEQLAAMDDPTLDGIAATVRGALATAQPSPQQPAYAPPSYAGAAGAVPSTNAGIEEEGLPLPSSA